jgi:hypothetical protein
MKVLRVARQQHWMGLPIQESIARSCRQARHDISSSNSKRKPWLAGKHSSSLPFILLLSVLLLLLLSVPLLLLLLLLSIPLQLSWSCLRAAGTHPCVSTPLRLQRGQRRRKWHPHDV